jgi:ubiquinone biosynthesis protein UbiJ
MSGMPLFAAGLEEACNAVLRMDPYTRSRLARLSGKSIALELRGLGLRIGLLPQQDGHLRVQVPASDAVDATLAGSPLDLLAASDDAEASRQLFAGQVQISGDSGLGQGFGRILAGLDIDWEEQLSRVLGDVAAHDLGRVARAAARYGREQRTAAASTLGEYLSEEARLTPPAAELQAFCDDVDRLHEDSDRLAARLALLRQRIERLGGAAE